MTDEALNSDPAAPTLDDEQLALLAGFGQRRHVEPGDLGPDWDALGRQPLPFETSQPGLFAVGDLRSGSMKRVASAVGEGSAAIRSVHEHLSVPT